MRTLVCQQCTKDLDPLQAIVEWMSSNERIHCSETIRLVHKSCVYWYSHYRTMEVLKRNDHWLPFWQLSEFMEIPTDVEWDNEPVAMAMFKDYIKHKNKLSKEVK